MPRSLAALSLALALTAAPSPAQDAPPAEDGPAKDAPAQDLDEKVRQRLTSQVLSLNLTETPLGEAIDFLRDVTFLSYVVHPDVELEPEVTLRLQNVRLDALLKDLLGPSQLEARPWCGAVLIAPAGHDPGAPPAPGGDDAGKALASRKVTLNFPGTPMDEVLQFLRDITGLKVEVAPAAAARAERAEVSLRVRELPLHAALTLCTHPWGLTWRTTEDGRVVIDALPERAPAPPATAAELMARLARRASLAAEDEDLRQVCARLQASTGIEHRVEGVPLDSTMSVDLQDIRLSELLDVVARLYGARWAVEERAVVFRPAR